MGVCLTFFICGWVLWACHLHAMCHAQQFSRSEDIPAHCVSLVKNWILLTLLLPVSPPPPPPPPPHTCHWLVPRIFKEFSDAPQRYSAHAQKVALRGSGSLWLSRWGPEEVGHAYGNIRTRVNGPRKRQRQRNNKCLRLSKVIFHFVVICQRRI